jgi:hypothetical protein
VYGDPGSEFDGQIVKHDGRNRQAAAAIYESQRRKIRAVIVPSLVLLVSSLLSGDRRTQRQMYWIISIGR